MPVTALLLSFHSPHAKTCTTGGSHISAYYMGWLSKEAAFPENMFQGLGLLCDVGVTSH